MKTKQMLIALGQIDDQYIAEYWENALPRKQIASLQRNKILLIAAVITAMLMLMGCAWALLHLEDLKIATQTITQYVYDENGNGLGYQEIPRDILSPSGLKGSPNYLAAAEWYAFTQEYDPDNAKQNEYYSQSSPQTFPEEYDAYWPYSQEMVDKLDELALKYDLKLLGEAAQYQSLPDFLNGIRSDHLLRADSKIRMQFQNGHRYEAGNFGCVFELEPVETEGEDWPEYIFGTLYCYRKDNLDTRLWIEQENDRNEEWNYTTLSGQTVLICNVPVEYGTTVFCDREDSTLVLTISTLRKPQGDVLSTALHKEQIETIVDSFDFNLASRL